MFDHGPVDEAVDIIARESSPKLVVVLGSAATGKANDLSDLDLLVVMDSDKDWNIIESEMYRATAHVHLPMDIMVLSTNEFNESMESIYSFTNEIMRTGRIAFEA